MIMGWVAVGNVFPVIKSDMEKLMGKSHYKNYDTHYAPVKPANPSDPKNAVFLPVERVITSSSSSPSFLSHLMIEHFGKQMDEIKFDELVVFTQFQAIPAYILTFQTMEKIETPLPQSPRQEPTISPQSPRVAQPPTQVEFF